MSGSDNTEFQTGTTARDTWHPVITSNTTTASYWLNWRFLLCATWVLISITITSTLILKHEKCLKSKEPRGGGGEDVKQEKRAEEETLYDDETWMPCLRGTHPAWLLAFRVCAFFLLLVLLVFAVLVDGASLFYYYTQWTFTLVTIYFGLGVMLSIHGCLLYHKRTRGDKIGITEQGKSAIQAAAGSSSCQGFGIYGARRPADKWAYAFQIIFQMNAGAVMLTDCVFWFILVPFLTSKENYYLSPLTIIMHSLNAVFLFADTALNSMRFPWFRIAYFFGWSVAYVLFQWIVHSCFNIWWPYPFLDFSSSYAPLWYFTVGVMHLPCYGAFSFIVTMKHSLFSRWFPDSYQSQR